MDPLIAFLQSSVHKTIPSTNWSQSGIAIFQDITLFVSNVEEQPCYNFVKLKKKSKIAPAPAERAPRKLTDNGTGGGDNATDTTVRDRTEDQALSDDDKAMIDEQLKVKMEWRDLMPEDYNFKADIGNFIDDSDGPLNQRLSMSLSLSRLVLQVEHSYDEIGPLEEM